MIDPLLNEIHLSLCYYDAIDDSLLRGYREILSVAERDKESRFVFERGRRCYVVTRALMRSTLGRFLQCAPQELKFVTNEYGRPEVAGEAAKRKLSFNLSHTHGLIALAVSREQSIGVDVENVERRAVSMDIADRYFASSESQALFALSEEQRRDRFYQYWTLKESYVKAHGKGLSLPLDQFSFHLSDGRLSLAVDERLADNPDKWWFCLWRPSSRHIMALCTSLSAMVTPRFTITETVPFASDTPIMMTPTHVSNSTSFKRR